MSSRISGWLKANSAKYPSKEKLVHACASTLHVSMTDVAALLGIKPPVIGKSDRRKGRKVGMSRTEFLSTHDADTRVRNAIRAALANITTDQIFKDAEFRQECDCHTSNWRHIADEAEFRKFQFQVAGGGKGQIFWAHPDTVKWAISKMPRAKEL